MNMENKLKTFLKERGIYNEYKKFKQISETKGAGSGVETIPEDTKKEER